MKLRNIAARINAKTSNLPPLYRLISRSHASLSRPVNSPAA